MITFIILPGVAGLFARVAVPRPTAVSEVSVSEVSGHVWVLEFHRSCRRRVELAWNNLHALDGLERGFFLC